MCTLNMHIHTYVYMHTFNPLCPNLRTHIVRSSVHTTQTGWICVTDTGHVQIQNVIETRPQDVQEILTKTANKSKL